MIPFHFGLEARAESRHHGGMDLLRRSFRFWVFLILWGGLPAPGGASQNDWPRPFQSRWGLGLVVGDPEGWGVTAKFWLDRETALQPAFKLGWGGNGALECDLLWHNYRWIRSQGDDWPVYGGFGAVLDTQGPRFGVRGVLGAAYQMEDLPGDFFAQLVPTYGWGGVSAPFQLYGEVGLRLFL